MSVFDQTDQTKDQTAQQQTNNESWLERLVKEKGDNWRDPEVLAKGKYEADQHIKNLEMQLEELRKDLEQQEYSRQLLAKLQEKAAPPTEAKPEVTDGGTKQGNTSLDASDLTGLIEKVLTQREASMTAAQRLRETEQKLEQMFGTEAKNVVRQKAAQLGISLERLRELSSESPTAFFALIGEAPPKEQNTTTRSTVNTASAFTASGERNNEFYQAMRRDKPTEFWSPKVQRQMLEDRKRLGDKFY